MPGPFSGSTTPPSPTDISVVNPMGNRSPGESLRLQNEENIRRDGIAMLVRIADGIIERTASGYRMVAPPTRGDEIATMRGMTTNSHVGMKKATSDRYQISRKVHVGTDFLERVDRFCAIATGLTDGPHKTQLSDALTQVGYGDMTAGRLRDGLIDHIPRKHSPENATVGSDPFGTFLNALTPHLAADHPINTKRNEINTWVAAPIAAAPSRSVLAVGLSGCMVFLGRNRGPH